MNEQEYCFGDNLDLYLSLCLAFNALLPKSKLFTPIAGELLSGTYPSIQDFSPEPEVPIGYAETLLDIMTTFEKNVYAVKCIVYENILLLAEIGNTEYQENSELPSVKDKVKFNTNLRFYEVFQEIYQAFKMLLLSSIIQRFEEKNIQIIGDIEIRKNYTIVQMPVREKNLSKKSVVLLFTPLEEESSKEDLFKDYKSPLQ
jgi:hypothetical protein